MQTIPIIYGATASGKSSIAIQLAQRLITDGKTPVIINADSMQVYEDIPIITNQPTDEEMSGVEHRLFGIIPASERCSAGRWLALAEEELRLHLKEEVQPILVGGTGLYIKSLMYGINEIPATEPGVRKVALTRLEQVGYDAMRTAFKAKDPLTEARLEAGNTQRLLRAWEVLEQTDIPLAEWQEKPTTPPMQDVEFKGYFVDKPREEIYEKINSRFENMVELGIVDEIKSLMEQQLDVSLPAMRAHGVPEIIAYLKGEMSIEDAIAQAQKNTRHYAKRQFTWFKNQLPEFTAISEAGEIV